MPISKYTYGLDEIKLDGTKIGEVFKGTCKFNAPEPTLTKFYEEGKTNPKLIIQENGEITLEFSIMNPTLQFCKQYLGGTYDDTLKKWSFGNESGIIVPGEFDIISKQGKDILVKEGYLSASIEWDISDTALFLVKCKVFPLLPEDGSEPIEVTEKA